MASPKHGGSQSQNPGEHRRAARVGVLTELGEVVTVNLGSQTGLLVDVSAGGIAVQAVYPILPQASVDIGFRLPLTGDWIEAVCQLAWVDKGSRGGLKFVRVGDGPRRRLDAWLSEHLEEAGTVAGAVSGSEAAAEAVEAVFRQAVNPVAAEKLAKADTGTPEQVSVSGAASVSEALTHAVELARRLTGADGAAVVLRQPEGVFCRASAGEAPDVGSRLKPHAGFTAECLRTGGVVLSADVENDPRAHPATAKRLRLRSILIVPIRVQGSVVAAVEVLSSRPSFFDVAQAAMLWPVTEMIGSALAPATPEPEEQPRMTRTAPEPAPAELVSLPGPVTLALRSWIAPYVAAACLLLLPIIGMLLLGRSGRRTSGPTPAHRAELQQKPAAAQEKMGEETADAPLSRQPHPLRQEKGQKVPPAKPSKVATARRLVANPPAPVEAARRAIPQIAPSNTGSGSQKILPPPDEATIPVRPIANHPTGMKTTTRSTPHPVIAPVAVSSIPQENTLLASLFDIPPQLPRLSAPSGRMGVSEAIMGRPISQPLPTYPEQARRLGVQGSVILRGVIAADGRIKQVHALEGDPALAQPAVDAMKNWLYAPTYLDRVPVEMETIDELKFSMGKSEQVSAPLHIPDGAVRGRPISQPLPTYPEQARRLGVQGSVILRGVIAVDGRVKQLRLVQGNPLLAQCALEAVSNWHFGTSYLNRVPIEVETTMVVTFKLHN
jgi:TonB family protein